MLRKAEEEVEGVLLSVGFQLLAHALTSWEQQRASTTLHLYREKTVITNQTGLEKSRVSGDVLLW